MEALNKLLAKYPWTAQKNYLVIHQTPLGISNPHITPDVNIEDLTPFTRIFCGHIHKKETIGKLQVLGSPLHRDLGDIGDEKGIWLFDTETDVPFFQTLDFPTFSYSDKPGHYYVERPKLSEKRAEEQSFVQSKFSSSLGPEILIKNFLETQQFEKEEIDVLYSGYLKHNK